MFEYRYCFFEAESFKVEELVDSETNEPEFALYANDKLLLITDKCGVRRIRNQLDYLLRGGLNNGII